MQRHIITIVISVSLITLCGSTTSISATHSSNNQYTTNSQNQNQISTNLYNYPTNDHSNPSSITNNDICYKEDDPYNIISSTTTTSTSPILSPITVHGPRRPLFLHRIIDSISSKTNQMLSCAQQETYKNKMIQHINRMSNKQQHYGHNTIDTQQQQHHQQQQERPQFQLSFKLPPAVISPLSKLRRSVLETNMYYMNLPFATRGGSTTATTASATAVSSVKKRKKSNDYNSKNNTNNYQKKRKQQRRKNNTGFYYGIQDDVFFKTDNDKVKTPSQTSTTNKNKRKDVNRNNNIDYEYNIKPPSTTLSDIMGETLLELREMREDIMALREELHYIKEEMKRNYQQGSSDEYLDDEDFNNSYGDYEYNRVEGDQGRSLARTIHRRKEFDLISKDVEKWAHKLLFEENGEEEFGWKEVICNKMVRNKFNKEGKTKCYIKVSNIKRIIIMSIIVQTNSLTINNTRSTQSLQWMKDSRKSGSSLIFGENNEDDDKDNTEYPCIKCYATLDAPIDQVCNYLAKESNMPEYNDLVVAYRDLESIGPQSKICWSKCPQILFIKPRDFVTFCHHRWRKDGTQIVVNQACEHEDAPGNDEEGDGRVCRAHALRGANCEFCFSSVLMS